MPENEMTLQEFYDYAAKHDWYSEYSDDNSMVMKGRRRYKVLSEAAEALGPDYEKLLIEIHDHKFSGEAWETKQLPMPARPT